MCKKSVTYKVDNKIVEQFNISAKENALNKSQWLENKMKEFIEKNKNEQ